MRCAFRFLLNTSALARLYVFLLLLAMMLILPLRARCGASEHIPRLAGDKEGSAGEFADISASFAGGSVRQPLYFHAAPSLRLSGPLTQETAGIQIEQLTPSGPRFRVMLTGGAGYGADVHRLSHYRSSGGVGSGTLRFAFARDFYLGFSYKRQKLGVEDSFTEETGEDQRGNPVPTSLNWDISLDEMMLVFGWTSSPSSWKSPITYADVGAGAIKVIESATRSDGSRYAAADENETMFALLLTAGGIIPLFREVGLNLEGDWIVTSLNPRHQVWENLFALRIGLAVMLGGG